MSLRVLRCRHGVRVRILRGDDLVDIYKHVLRRLKLVIKNLIPELLLVYLLGEELTDLQVLIRRLRI